MLNKIFKEVDIESSEDTVSTPDGDLWAVFQIIRDKTPEGFNNFVKGCRSLYSAWQGFQAVEEYGNIDAQSDNDAEIANAERELEERLDV